MQTKASAYLRRAEALAASSAACRLRGPGREFSVPGDPRAAWGIRGALIHSFAPWVRSQGSHIDRAGSYLNQPRSESDVSPNTALRSPSCASSDRRSAKSSPNDVPLIGTEWNKVLFFFTGKSSERDAWLHDGENKG
ncbi:uncharacterized protein AKAME5_000806500 [Lates japonicus]|uniref:Uncharacterized protein n=1 Tax=Lates japonicus TaxID=270547 RepID=A0AAD3MIW8_LATJO|nr:uncharacterized protein AKAME5_000806500 [Lates japonicus]